MKSTIFWDIIKCSLLNVNWHFGETYRLNLQGQEHAKQETTVKTSGKHSNRQARILDSIGNRREMEECNSVPVGSPMGQNETTSTEWLSDDHQMNQ
jgi:hypothetical protein